jgi:hypothetical protein
VPSPAIQGRTEGLRALARLIVDAVVGEPTEALQDGPAIPRRTPGPASRPPAREAPPLVVVR